MTFSEGQRSHYFEEVEESFGRHRFAYPTEVIDKILAFGGKGWQPRILEIGCGVGEATALFAPRGLPMVCLEPGPALLASARQTCRDYPDLQFVQSTFDDWNPGSQRFDLVIAARALHWVRHDLRFTKTADVLAPSGILAIFHKQELPGESACSKTIEALVSAALPERPCGDARALRAQFAASENFSDYREVTMDWTIKANRQSYISDRRSAAELQSLPVPEREALLAAMAEVIDAHGGEIDVTLRLYLSMARRRRSPRWWRKISMIQR